MRLSTPGRNILHNAKKSSGSNKPSSSLSHICLDGHRQMVHEYNSMNFPRLFLKVSTSPLSIPTSKLEKGAIGKEIHTYMHAYIHAYMHTKYELFTSLFHPCVILGGWDNMNRMFFLWLPSLHMNSTRLFRQVLCSSYSFLACFYSFFIHFGRCYRRKIP